MGMASTGPPCSRLSCLLLTLIPHALPLPLQSKFGVLKSGAGGLEEMAEKVKIAVSQTGEAAHKVKLAGAHGCR